MDADHDPDVRGRTVVWDSGSTRPPRSVVRRRRRWSRLSTALLAVVAAAGLGVAVGTSVLPGPQLPQPDQPLWQPTRPAAAAGAQPTPRTQPVVERTPSPTPPAEPTESRPPSTPAASSTPATTRSARDDHRGSGSDDDRGSGRSGSDSGRGSGSGHGSGGGSGHGSGGGSGHGSGGDD